MLRVSKFRFFLKLWILAVGLSFIIVRNSLADSTVTETGWSLPNALSQTTEPFLMIVIGFLLIYTASLVRDMLPQPGAQKPLINNTPYHP